jgi:hypothetical protein
MLLFIVVVLATGVKVITRRWIEFHGSNAVR